MGGSLGEDSFLLEGFGCLALVPFLGGVKGFVLFEGEFETKLVSEGMDHSEDGLSLEAEVVEFVEEPMGCSRLEWVSFRHC